MMDPGHELGVEVLEVGEGVENVKAGDLCYLDRAVWHQAMPITDGVKWAIIIFFKVHRKRPKKQ